MVQKERTTTALPPYLLTPNTGVYCHGREEGAVATPSQLISKATDSRLP